MTLILSVKKVFSDIIKKMSGADQQKAENSAGKKIMHLDGRTTSDNRVDIEIPSDHEISFSTPK